MKYIKKISLVLLLLGFTSFAVSDNFEAWDIKPIDGSTALTFSIFNEVKVIQEKVLCNHCGRTSSNGIRCLGICVADNDY